MGSSCCKSKEFTISLVNLPTFYYEEEVSPLHIDSLLSTKSKSHILSSQCSLEQNQMGEFVFSEQQSINTLFLLKSNVLTGNFTLHKRIKDIQQHSIWKVLRKNQTEMLSKGDILKIGLQEFKVFEIGFQEKEEKVLTPQIDHCEVCRYCFKSSFTEMDPLLSLCKCAGSVKFIHLWCLRTWMKSKAQKSDKNNLQLFKFEMPQCEICKTNWPRNFTHHNRYHQLYSFAPELEDFALPSSPKTPYVVFQSTGVDKNGNDVSHFVKINLNQSCLIGSDRANCRLELDLGGISPLHTKIFLMNNNIFVSDCGSTSGTLIKAKNVQFICPSKGILLLYKTMLINITLKRPFLDCDSSSQPENFIEITKQNEYYMT